MENFQEKAGIPAFLVKIYAFSFLFMMFWAFLTRFPAFFVKSHSHAWNVLILPTPEWEAGYGPGLDVGTEVQLTYRRHAKVMTV